jgi:hydroxymethylbilane synthase
MENQKKYRIGTRGSELALWQARHVASLIGEESCEIVVIKTQGDIITNVSFDKMEGKGFFTKEIEASLLAEETDLAIHSLKDLPTAEPDELTVAAVPEGADPRDVILVRPGSFDPSSPLPVKKGSVIGTSSFRRRSQVLAADGTLTVEALRGNINTRVRKLKERQYDAIILANAGINRIELDLTGLEVHPLDPEVLLPAPAQGALGVQIRRKDRKLFERLQPLNHGETLRRIQAERSFLRAFGGGCHIPLGAHARLEGEDILLRGFIGLPDGSRSIYLEHRGRDPERTGIELADIFRKEGAGNLL